MASREPVEAPDGTAARPIAPDSSNTSHSTVGLPRESMTSRPIMSTIALMVRTLYSLKFTENRFQGNLVASSPDRAGSASTAGAPSGGAAPRSGHPTWLRQDSGGSP